MGWRVRVRRCLPRPKRITLAAPCSRPLGPAARPRPQIPGSEQILFCTGNLLRRTPLVKQLARTTGILDRRAAELALPLLPQTRLQAS